MRSTVFYSLLLLSLLLVGCQPRSGPILSFSAQQAAVDAVANQMGRHANVIPESVQVLQSQSLDGRAFVLIRYEQVSEGRQEKCTAMYETERSALGSWSPRSGGGGCAGHISGEPPPEPPLEVSGGHSSGGGVAKRSYSHANGLVHQADIVLVRVTWEDGQVQEAPVVNDSYLAVRPGSVTYQSVEGLDADGEVVTAHTTIVAPGKRP